MRSNMLNATIRTAALAGVLLISGVSNAADVYLTAQAEIKALLDGDGGTIESVPMWRFVCDTAAATNPNCADSAAGAQINLAATDTLKIILNNDLNTPVSIVIPGQGGGGNPVRSADGRVQSFTHETLGGGGTAEYNWTPFLSPGTYLYQSGTHPSIQVPMGPIR